MTTAILIEDVCIENGRDKKTKELSMQARYSSVSRVRFVFLYHQFALGKGRFPAHFDKVLLEQPHRVKVTESSP
jgi:hypothetical protein